MSGDFDPRKDSQINKIRTEASNIHKETPIPEVIFVTVTENSSAVTNDTQGPQKNPHHRK